jgi:hypothetical protein
MTISFRDIIFLFWIPFIRTPVQGPGSSGWGLDVRLTTLLCKEIIVAKSEVVKTQSDPAESSKEDCGSERTILPMMMMI